MRGVDGRQYTLGGPTPQQEDRRRAFFGAIVGGQKDGRFNFEDLAKEFANERVPVYGMSILTGVKVNQVGDTADIQRECKTSIYTQGVGAILYNRIMEKGFIPPAECGSTYNLTPLMLAKLLGREAVVKTLLANGADPDETETITYSRKGRILGGPKETLTHAWTYKDFSSNPADWTFKGIGRRRRTGRVRRMRKGVRRTLRRK